MMLPASCGVVACLYFLCLLVGLPLWASAAVILAGVAVLCWWLSGLAKRVFKENVPPLHPVAVAAFLICLYWLATGAAETAAKHGGWDAMAIWNFHARYLADGHLWRNLFLNTDTEHPDYPLCLPSLVSSPLCPLLFSPRVNHYHTSSYPMRHCIGHHLKAGG